MIYCDACLQPHNEGKHVCTSPRGKFLCILCNLYFVGLDNFEKHLSYTHKTTTKRFLNLSIASDMNPYSFREGLALSDTYNSGILAYKRLIMHEAPKGDLPHTIEPNSENVQICLNCITIGEHICARVGKQCLFCYHDFPNMHELLDHLELIHNIGNSTLNSVVNALVELFGPKESTHIHISKAQFHAKCMDIPNSSDSPNVSISMENPPMVAIATDRRNIGGRNAYCNLCTQEYRLDHECRDTNVECFICETGFENMQKLDRHFAKIHDSVSVREYVERYSTPDMVKGDKYFIWSSYRKNPKVQKYCENCLQYYKSDHTCIQVNVRCLICGIMFGTLNDLKEHISIKHQIGFDGRLFRKIKCQHCA